MLSSHARRQRAPTTSMSLGFSFSSCLIVLAGVARVEEVGLSQVGSSGKLSLSEKAVLVLLAVEAGVVEEGSGCDGQPDI